MNSNSKENRYRMNCVLISTRTFLILLGVVSLGAFALRLGAGFEMLETAAVKAPPATTDMATYRQLAGQMLEGVLPDKFYYQPFYYAVFLPVVFFLFGSTAFGVILVQSALGAAAVWLTGLVAARLFGRWAGIIAAALLALQHMHIFYTPFALMAVLQSFWIILLLYLTIRALRTPSGWRWAMAGVVCGLGILTRGNVWFLAPVSLAGMGWRLRHRPRRAIGLAALFLLLCYLPQLPFAVHNYRATGRWTGPSTAAEAVLALGNNPEAPPGGLTYPPTYHYWMHEAAADASTRTPVTEHIFDWMVREPLAYAELKLRMFILFWNRLEIPNNVSFERDARSSTLLKMPFLAGFGLVGSLALGGLLYGVYRHREKCAILTVYGFVVMYCGATILFYVLARFRLPLLPVLCVCGGGFIGDLGRVAARSQFSSRSRRRLLAALLIGALAASFVIYGFQFYQTRVEAGMMCLVRPHGVVTELDGKVRIYDHGPQALGGWQALSWPDKDFLIQKVFRIPLRYTSDIPPVVADDTSQHNSPAPNAVHRMRNVRFPLLVSRDSEIIVTLDLPSATRVVKKVRVVSGWHPLVWVNVEIPAAKRPIIDGEFTAVRVRLEDRLEGNIQPLIDTRRDYGRSAIMSQPGGIVPVRGEFTVEIDLEAL